MSTGASDPETSALLRARARALAQPLAAAQGDAGPEILLFRLGRDRLALDTPAVQEVLPLTDLAVVPGIPEFLRGVVNVRGRITVALDLQRYLGLPVAGLADLHHVVLVRGNGLQLALLATAIEGVQPLPANGLQPALPAGGVRTDCLRGIAPDGAMVLDVERILGDPALVVHEPEAR